MLASARVYSALQRALGAARVRRVLVAEHLRPAPGERVLDLGCGPGDVRAELPAVEYVGVDHSERYLAAARARHAGRGRFVRADLRLLRLEDEEPFDAAIAIGVLHHLDDGEGAAMLASAAHALKSSGRLITIDPALGDRESPLARWLILRDRGRHLRSSEGYAGLARGRFDHVVASTRHDLARVPYCHAILECTEPRP